MIRPASSSVADTPIIGIGDGDEPPVAATGKTGGGVVSAPGGGGGSSVRWAITGTDLRLHDTAIAKTKRNERAAVESRIVYLLQNLEPDQRVTEIFFQNLGEAYALGRLIILQQTSHDPGQSQ